MLKTQKQITLTGKSSIDGTVVVHYTASIDATDPSAMTAPRTSIVNNQLYKENRTTLREEAAEFEEAVYALQAELQEEVTEE